MKIYKYSGEDLWKRALIARRMMRRTPGLVARDTSRRRWYFRKMLNFSHPEWQLYPLEIFWSFVGSLFGIGILSAINYAVFGHESQLLLMGTFGAAAMLLFGAPKADFAQPRNVIGGHVISALVGVTVCLLFGSGSPVGVPLAVACAIAAMHLTGTLHPPGGGTALLMLTSPALIELGYKAVLFPVGLGATILVACALVTNNLSRARRYPMYWW